MSSALVKKAATCILGLHRILCMARRLRGRIGRAPYSRQAVGSSSLVVHGTRYALLFTSLVPGGDSHLVAFLAALQGRARQGCADYRRALQMKQPIALHARNCTAKPRLACYIRERVNGLCLQCECHQRAACPDPACVLCFAFCLLRVPVAASLLLHCAAAAAPRPPARCAAALPCNTRTTPTHTLDQPASDLKASDDGAPLLHCYSPALVRTALSVLLHDCALPPPPTNHRRRHRPVSLGRPPPLRHRQHTAASSSSLPSAACDRPTDHHPFRALRLACLPFQPARPDPSTLACLQQHLSDYHSSFLRLPPFSRPRNSWRFVYRSRV